MNLFLIEPTSSSAVFGAFEVAPQIPGKASAGKKVSRTVTGSKDSSKAVALHLLVYAILTIFID
jgi:hypothetical protein